MSSRKAIFGTIAVSIAFVMELTLVPLLLPSIQDQLLLSVGELAWIFNSYGIAVAIGVVIGGWLGDTFSTKKVFAAGGLLFAVGSMLVAFASGLEMMIVGRALQGAGGGIFSPLVPILLTRASPDRPGRVLVVWGVVAGYVAAAAPIVYSSVFSGFGWRLAFVLFAVVAVAALVVGMPSQGADPPQSARLTRQDYFGLLRSRELWVMYGYVFCTYGCITYYLFRLPILLAENNFTVVSIGMTLSIMWLSFAVVGTFLKNKVDQPAVRSILLVAPVFIALGFLLAYFSNHITSFVLSAALIGTGFACSNSPSTQLILGFAPKGLSALSAGCDISFARIGGVVVIALFAISPFGLTVFAMTGLSIIACFLVFVATREASD